MRIKDIILLLVGLFLLVACDKEELGVEETVGHEKNDAGTKKEIVVLQNGIRLNKMGSDYIFQGDILLTPEQVKLLVSRRLPGAVTCQIGIKDGQAYSILFSCK